VRPNGQLALLVAFALVGVLCARPLGAADGEDGPKGGIVTGILTATGESWIAVKAEGERRMERYTPRLDDDGTYDHKMLDAFDKLITCNLVQVKWVEDEGRRVVALRTVPPGGKAGITLGTVVSKGASWIDVKPAKGGFAERYIPRWIGGLPKAGGGLDEDVVRLIKEAEEGDRVKIQWFYDVRKRLTRMENYGPAETKDDVRPAANPPENNKPGRTGPGEKLELGALPKAMKGFRGYFIGRLVSLDGEGCGLKIEKVVPLQGSDAEEPDCAVGLQVRLSYVAVKNEDGGLEPSKELRERVVKLSEDREPITVRVRVEDETTTIAHWAWPGEHETPDTAEMNRLLDDQ